MLDIPEAIRRYVAIAVAIAILCLCFALLTMCQGRDVDRGRIRTENATGRALDTVARETPIIRQDQEEKQRAVDEIEGSDQRLPDGYGDSLQRVRDRERRNP